MSLYISVNMLCAIMIIILMFMVHRGVMHEADQKTFFNLCFHTQLLFSLDVFWELLDGSAFPGARVLNYIVNAAYFAQCGILCYYWSQYSLFLSGSSRFSGTFYKVLFALPMAIEVVLSIASVWTGWYFTIDSANHYHRGDWLFIQVTVMFIYLVYSLLVAVFTIKRQRDVVNRNKLYAISALEIFESLDTPNAKAYNILASGIDAITFQPQTDFIMMGEYESTEPVNDDDYDAGFYDEMNSRYDSVYQIVSAVFYSLIPHFEIGVK